MSPDDNRKWVVLMARRYNNTKLCLMSGDHPVMNFTFETDNFSQALNADSAAHPGTGE